MIHGIIALDDNGAIGFEGGLPWPKIPADIALFRRLTEGHAVVMGRKTWESLPLKFRPLPGRENVVVTRDIGPWGVDDVIAANTVDAALSVVAMLKLDAFIIGGAQIYALAAPRIECWHITRVAGIHEADTFFVPDLREFERKTAKTIADGVRYEQWWKQSELVEHVALRPLHQAVVSLPWAHVEIDAPYRLEALR